MKKNKENGITLVALIVTIIVLIILSGVIILSLSGENGVLRQSIKAKMTSELSVYQEELKMYKMNKRLENEEFLEGSLTAGKQNLSYNTKDQSESGNIKTIIPSISDKYIKVLEISKGEILLNTENEDLIKAAQGLEIAINPYEIIDGVLKSTNNNLLIMDETGTITIPDSVTSIGEGAFANVDGLKRVIIPGTCKEIAQNAFANNSSLEAVIIQDGVEKIGQAAFRYCTNLKSVNMADSVIEIGASAFFGDTSLEEINLPSGLKSIKAYLFYQCQNLKEVILPESTRNILDAAFTGCTSLESITVPKSVTIIKGTAFNGTKSLKTILIDPENTNFEFKDGILLGNNKQEMCIILESAIKSSTFVVPEGVTKLLSNQLSSFIQISAVEIPNTVTSIEPLFFSNNITKVTINNNNSTFETDGKAVYTKDGNTIVKYYANESTVTVKSGICYIKDYAFSNKNNITEVELPDSIISVGSQVFSGCSKLASIHLGKSVNKFDNMSIYGSGIENVTIDEENPNYSIINGALYNKDGTIFISPIKGTITSYEIPNGVKEINTYAFHNQHKMANIILPDTLEKIGAAFNYCTSLTKVEIPSSVTQINSNCFTNCGNNLTQIIVHKPKGSIAGSPWGCMYGEKAVIWE